MWKNNPTHKVELICAMYMIQGKISLDLKGTLQLSVDYDEDQSGREDDEEEWCAYEMTKKSRGCP